MTIKDTTKQTTRHGNCVPFILTNTKTGAITYKGSLKEIAHKLKITQAHASVIGQKGTKFKQKYTITRVPFAPTLTFE
mgnify:CR=1 FL=1